jgi:class 3 adenylate cyclase
MAGVIGTRRFAYDVWGDTVNIAARLEVAGQPNRVLASATTVKGLGSDYSFDGPHKIDTKEGRVLEAFFVSSGHRRSLMVTPGRKEPQCPTCGGASS